MEKSIQIHLEKWLQYNELFGNCRQKTLSYYRQKIECFLYYSHCESVEIFENIDIFEEKF